MTQTPYAARVQISADTRAYRRSFNRVRRDTDRGVLAMSRQVAGLAGPWLSVAGGIALVQRTLGDLEGEQRELILATGEMRSHVLAGWRDVGDEVSRTVGLTRTAIAGVQGVARTEFAGAFADDIDLFIRRAAQFSDIIGGDAAANTRVLTALMHSLNVPVHEGGQLVFDLTRATQDYAVELNRFFRQANQRVAIAERLNLTQTQYFNLLGQTFRLLSSRGATAAFSELDTVLDELARDGFEAAQVFDQWQQALARGGYELLATDPLYKERVLDQSNLNLLFKQGALDASSLSRELGGSAEQFDALHTATLTLSDQFQILTNSITGLVDTPLVEFLSNANESLQGISRVLSGDFGDLGGLFRGLAGLTGQFDPRQNIAELAGGAFSAAGRFAERAGGPSSYLPEGYRTPPGGRPLSTTYNFNIQGNVVQEDLARLTSGVDEEARRRGLVPPPSVR